MPSDNLPTLKNSVDSAFDLAELATQHELAEHQRDRRTFGDFIVLWICLGLMAILCIALVLMLGFSSLVHEALN